MVTKIPEKFEVKTTTRYRRQNMAKAMRGKIERAIVELITNSDDSYRELEDNGVTVSGKIRIDIERKRGKQCSIVSVRDRAGGMSGKEMYLKLGAVGIRASGFELGKARRGLLGRGAKDIAIFGSAHFESIKNNKYSHLIISPSLSAEFKARDKEATQEHRNRLGISRGNGTVVILEVNSEFVIPRHEKMIDLLSRFYSLRDIMSNPNREVILTDQHSRRSDLLTYKYPSGEIVLDKDIDIPGYPEAKARITVKKHETAFQSDTSPLREGILIKSSSAIHDCTYFQLDSDVYCWRFTGELLCDYIDKLVREYDEREESTDNPVHPTRNPILLLDPNRDGLAEEHPFAHSLKQECRKLLKTLVDGLKSEENIQKKKVTSARLDHKLGILSKEISSVFEKKLTELEEELLPGSAPIGKITNLPIGLHIIPPGEEPIIVNTAKVFTTKIVGYEELNEEIPIDIVSSNNDISVKESPVYLKKFSEDKKIGSTTFVLDSEILGAESLIEVNYNGYNNVILVTVVEPPTPPSLPSGLSFDKPIYRLKVNKEKTLILWLNSEGAGGNEYEADISCDCPEIVIKGGGRCLLKETKIHGMYMGKIRILGRHIKSKGRVTAKVPKFPLTQCQAIVEESEGSHIKLEFIPDEEDFGSVRYKWDDENPYRLRIAAKHPSVRQYLGEPIDDDYYPGIESDLYHGILAEIVAEALAFNLLEKQFKVEGEQGLLDFTSVDANFHKNYSDFLKICHRTLNSNFKIQDLQLVLT